jgi:hypothetical protein
MSPKSYQAFNCEHFYDEVLAELSAHPDDVLNLAPGPGHRDSIRARLLNYASRTRQLDVIFERLEAKHFCSAQCPRKPVGCCWEHAYRMGNEDFFEFLGLQEVEARSRGWQQPGAMCPYLSDPGCPLVLFRPPACVRHMCTELMDALSARFGGQVRELNSSLLRISQDIRRSESIFSELDQAIAAGRSILALRPPGTR